MVTKPVAKTSDWIKHEPADMNVGQSVLMSPVPKQPLRDAKRLGCIPGSKSQWFNNGRWLRKEFSSHVLCPCFSRSS